jgi:hypothetical protein
MKLGRAIGISVSVLLGAGGFWTDASAARFERTPSTPPAVSDTGTGDASAISQFDASTGVLGQGDGSVTRGFSQTETSGGGDTGGSSTLLSLGRRGFTLDGYVETAGVTGAANTGLAGSLVGYTSVLRFNNAGLFSAAYTLTLDPSTILPSDPRREHDVPLPSTLALLATAVVMASGAHAIRRRRLGASA